MRHFQLPLAVCEGSACTVTGEDYHYLAHVLRVVEGDDLPVVDQTGAQYSAVVVRVGRTQIDLSIGPRNVSASARPAPEIALYQAFPKGRKLEQVVRSAVQAGVTRIVPVISERTVVNPNERFESRRDRLNRVAREAVQQSGARLAVVDSPVDLRSIERDRSAVSLVLHTQPLERCSFHGYLSDDPNRIELVVGPEGGLTDEEVSWLEARGFRPVSLGPLVLRTEVAGLYAVAAIRMILLERDQWQLTIDPLS